MDFVKKAMGGNEQQGQGQNQATTQEGSSSSGNQESGGFLSGIGNKMNEAAGGGKESEKNEDYLDKGTFIPPSLLLWIVVWRDGWLGGWIERANLVSGVDFVQEKFMGAGPQDNESAVEQAKDEQISDFIRGQYKSMSPKTLTPLSIIISLD
jgi:hypothetical protein